MSEAEVKLDAVFGDEFADVPLEGEDGAATDPVDGPANPQSGGTDFVVDAASREIDDRIKQAMTRALENPELPCVLVDLLSPGLAVTKMRGEALEPLAPWQHLAICIVAIGGCAVATNPGIRESLRLKKQVRGRKPHAAVQRGPPAGYGGEPDYDDMAEDHDPLDSFPDSSLEATGEPL